MLSCSTVRCMAHHEVPFAGLALIACTCLCREQIKQCRDLPWYALACWGWCSRHLAYVHASASDHLVQPCMHYRIQQWQSNMVGHARRWPQLSHCLQHRLPADLLACCMMYLPIIFRWPLWVWWLMQISRLNRSVTLYAVCNIPTQVPSTACKAATLFSINNEH